MRPSDTPAPKYIVVCVHDEYEQTVRLFCTEEAALADYKKWKDNSTKDNSTEVYFGNLIEVK